VFALQTLLLQAFVYRGQQLLPELRARLAQLQYTLDTVKTRCRHAGERRQVWAMLMLSSLLEVQHAAGAIRVVIVDASS
jgi:hypothetical protein